MRHAFLSFSNTPYTARNGENNMYFSPDDRPRFPTLYICTFFFRIPFTILLLFYRAIDHATRIAALTCSVNFYLYYMRAPLRCFISIGFSSENHCERRLNDGVRRTADQTKRIRVAKRYFLSLFFVIGNPNCPSIPTNYNRTSPTSV